MAWALKRTTRGGTIRWTGCYRDDCGRKRSAGTAPTKRLALDLATEEEVKLRRGQWIAPEAGMVTLDEYFSNEWLPNRELELGTIRAYSTHYNAGLRPTFGHLMLREITPSRIQGWVTSQKHAGLSARTIQARLILLQTVLAARRGPSAIRDGHLRSNPCADVTSPPMVRRNVTVYTPEQVDAVVAILDPWWRELVALLAETGCRWGEAQGLCVGDVWADHVVIRRTIVEVPTKLSGNGTRFVSKEYPKNRKPRRLGISAELSATIEELVSRRGLGPGDRLFARQGTKHHRGQVMRTEVWPGGRPVAESHFRGVWRRSCAAAGIPQLRIHDLRASNISWMLAGGADIATVMARAGHSQMATTQRYVAALDDTDERALTALRTLRRRRPPTRLRPTRDVDVTAHE